MIEILVLLLSVNLIQFTSSADSIDKMSFIIDNIYLGNKEAARHEDYLKENGITAVVNCAYSFKSKYKDVKFIRLYLKDDHEQKLFPKFDEAYEFVKENSKEGSKILVHCEAGRSRSASFVIYYLMREKGWDYKKCYEYVKEIRPNIRPNSSFVKQLKEYYEKNIKHKST